MCLIYVNDMPHAAKSNLFDMLLTHVSCTNIKMLQCKLKLQCNALMQADFDCACLHVTLISMDN